MLELFFKMTDKTSPFLDQAREAYSNVSTMEHRFGEIAAIMSSAPSEYKVAADRIVRSIVEVRVHARAVKDSLRKLIDSPPDDAFGFDSLREGSGKSFPEFVASFGRYAANLHASRASDEHCRCCDHSLPYGNGCNRGCPHEPSCKCSN